MGINGILNINKKEGTSSFNEINKIKKTICASKVGHTGTLDPFACGVLVVCLGEATKIIPYIMDADKEYIATMHLGKTTDTQDRTGKFLTTSPINPITDNELEKILNKYRGEIEQIPPMYSAIHYKGVRLYKLARKQQEVIRSSRKILIKKLSVLERSIDKIKIVVECSKGTYIRTICHDIGIDMGCGAYLEELTRTRNGNYKLENAIEANKITNADEASKYLTPIEQALSHFAAATIKEDSEIFVKNGKPISQINIKENINEFQDKSMLKIISTNKKLLAIGEKNEVEKKILIKRRFNTDVHLHNNLPVK
ncbi:tRNA pseudouridine(55) synthase TruB [Candidatus Poribacteria bacterium]|nr:tRNA pseudouridine(55) synthase TruB [Candidatus Poribacteria bacterium]